MDHEQFDQLARGLAAGASRRGMVRRLSGAAIGGVLVAIGAGQAEGRKNKRGGGKAKGKGKGKGKRKGGSQGAKITICHRTDSETDPFQVISVGPNAVAAHEAHGDLVDCPNLEIIDFETCTCVCPVAHIDCETGQQLDPATCACVGQPECLPEACTSQSNACQTCRCRNGGGCVCQLTVCPSGDCHPVNGCQTVAEVCAGKDAPNPCFPLSAPACGTSGTGRTCRCGTDINGNRICYDLTYCNNPDPVIEGACTSNADCEARTGAGSVCFSAENCCPLDERGVATGCATPCPFPSA